MKDEEDSEDVINIKFSLSEWNKALKKSRKTTPGKDQINYCMLNNLSDASKEILIELYNKVWEEGKLLNKWKEEIIVPICKPGKGLIRSYKPIAFKSCLGKVI